MTSSAVIAGVGIHPLGRSRCPDCDRVQLPATDQCPVGVVEFPEGRRVIGLLEDPPARRGDSVVPVVAQPADDLVACAFRLTAGAE